MRWYRGRRRDRKRFVGRRAELFDAGGRPDRTPSAARSESGACRELPKKVEFQIVWKTAWFRQTEMSR